MSTPQNSQPLPEGYELKKKKKPWYQRLGCIIPIALIVLLIIVMAVSTGDDTETGTTGDETTVTDNGRAGGNEGEAPAEEDESDVPSEFRNALTKGERYANNQNMSKQGVYNQLTSEFEGFSPEAAQYAIDNIEADWMENARVKGQRYYENQAMSPDAVYNQLTSQFEGFTAEEAQYAVDNLE